MDFRLSSLAVATWLLTIIVITSLGLTNPVWASAMCGVFLLVARTFLRHFANSRAEFKALLSMILLGAFLGTSIAAIRIWPLVSGPIAEASESKSVVSGIATITSDPVISQ